MKPILYLIWLFGFYASAAQMKEGYNPKIEPGACIFKADSSLKTKCGYLLVPENRNKPSGKIIKLPFIYVDCNNPGKKNDPVLFTGGGPGGSSLGIVQNVHRRSLIRNRDFIAFEQRGTQYAIPNLNCSELSEAIKTAYRRNLPKDSMVLEGVKRCRISLESQGIDLSGYNTEESAADIEDLLSCLKIDSINLFGISYSGGLMMAVLQNYPSRVRSLILDSPLPEFINIDEDEVANFNEALAGLFRDCDRDSVDKTLYGNLQERFQRYFSSLTGKSFSLTYEEKRTNQRLKINYSRNDLLDVIENHLFNFSKIKDVPNLITELIKGNHEPYVKELLDDIFEGTQGPSGMRLSVYCSDKMAYASKDIIKEQYMIYPFVAGYHINDVYQPMCDYWGVPSIRAVTKKPFYSNTPILLGAGDLDPACRPVYNDLISHYMPNSHRLLFINRSHGPLIGKEGDLFIGQFLDDPYKKIESEKLDIRSY